MKRARAVGVVVLVALSAIAALAPLITPFNPSASSGAPLTPPGSDHFLGTNDVGQDVFSQLLWGTRASMSVALVVTVLSAALSWSVGLAAGLWRRAEPILMGVTDLLIALPAVPLYLLILALVGPSQLTLVLSLGLLSWPGYARVVRARVIEVRGASYVEAARALGATALRVAMRHVAPATLELLPPKLVLTVRFAIFAEATLAFLGLGDPTARSWGTMIGTALSDPLVFVGGAWTWWVLPPAAGIVLAVLSTTWLITGGEERA